MSARLSKITLVCDIPSCRAEYEFHGYDLNVSEVRSPWAKNARWASAGDKDYCPAHAKYLTNVNK